MRQIPLFIAISMLATPLVASAAGEMEVEPNDSADMAQSLDHLFDRSFNPLIGENNPLRDGLPVYSSTDDLHAEISGSSEDPVNYDVDPNPPVTNSTYDWYSFTIDTPGSVAVIDIDCAWEKAYECSASGLKDRFDAHVHLIDTDGITRIADPTGGDDDGNAIFGYPAEQDPGSNSGGTDPDYLASRDPFNVYTFDTPGTYFLRVGSFGGYDDGSSTQREPLGDYLLHVSIIVEDDDGDGVVNDFDLCPNTPPGQSVDPAGCAADDILESVSNSIDALIGATNKDARKYLGKARKQLDNARAKIARNDVKDGLKKLKDTAKYLVKAKDKGADTDGLVTKLVDYSRAKAEAAIATSSNSKDVKKAEKEMAKAEKELRNGKPDKAIEYFAKAWDAVSDDDDNSSDDDSSDDDDSDDDSSD